MVGRIVQGLSLVWETALNSYFEILTRAQRNHRELGKNVCCAHDPVPGNTVRQLDISCTSSPGSFWEICAKLPGGGMPRFRWSGTLCPELVETDKAFEAGCLDAIGSLLEGLDCCWWLNELNE